MSRNRLLVTAAAVVAIVGIAVFGTTRLSAGTATANLSVSATVSPMCLITGGTLAFGAYDPVSVNATTDLTGSGTFTVACTKSAANVWVGMDLGSFASGSTRRMQVGSTGAFLNYELYKDNTATPAVWGNTLATGLAYTPAGKAAQTLTVYGKVPQGQDAAVGTYADTVLMTVNF